MNEVVIKAYQPHWNKLSEDLKKRIIKDKGKVNVYLLKEVDKDILIEGIDIRNEKSGFVCVGTDEGTEYLFLPKVLLGIENNNGWTKLSKNLPTDGEYFVYDDDGDIGYYFFFGDDNDYEHLKSSGITHYQKVTKPNKPIY